MNKLQLIMIGGLAATMISCTGSDNSTNGENSQTDTTKASYETSINIRFVNEDSISNNYELSKLISQEAQAQINGLQAYQAELENRLQGLAAQIQNKAQNNGYLTQAAYEADMNEAQKQSNQYQALLAQREQQVSDAIETRRKELRDSVENFIEAYNKEKKYDAILFRSSGLYFNPALDITDEVIKGLNERYKGKKADESADAAVPAATSLNSPTSPTSLTQPKEGLTTPTLNKK